MRGVRRFEHVTCTLGMVDVKVYLIPIASLLLCRNSLSYVQQSNISTTPVKIVSKFIDYGGTLSETRKKVFNKTILISQQIAVGSISN